MKMASERKRPVLLLRQQNLATILRQEWSRRRFFTLRKAEMKKLFG
jgi:hypothetical protein